MCKCYGITITITFYSNRQIIESGIGHDIAESMECLSAVILSYILAMNVNWKLSLAMCPIIVMTLVEIAVIVKVSINNTF